MRKFVVAAIVGAMALSGQAIAKETTKVTSSAVRVGAAKTATNQQVLGLTLAQSLLLAAGVVTLAVIVSDSSDDDNGGITTSP